MLSSAGLNASQPILLTEQPVGNVEDPSFKFGVMSMANLFAAAEHSEYDLIGMQGSPAPLTTS